MNRFLRNIGIILLSHRKILLKWVVEAAPCDVLITLCVDQLYYVRVFVYFACPSGRAV
jgi:hypothetical protein